jgi:serine/threonine-protein kinase
MAVEQRYRVVERLEAGGMAEVFKGESLSVQGFKKQVAIKRVLLYLAQNKNFISMFLDEARLGARLTHANIVTVFDIGAADNTFFIVMEFVDGCNLKTIIETYRQSGKRLGVKEALYIAMNALNGLSFAHELLDDDGNLLHIVHRDVSPPNILISKRGEVKVTDFGLAKATTQLEKTDPGVVKGKFSYLSPEAALGQPVDARTDVFALGIVIWEMLAGRRLFLGETDFQTVKMVQQAQIPSLSRINPEVDAELEGVLGKALTQDVKSRYQSASEFQDAIAGYLFSRKLKVTAFDIATLVKAAILTKAELKKGEMQPGQQSIIDRLIQEELLRFTSLDDMSDPLADSGGSAGGGGGDDDASKPLDAGLFENPADWFRDDKEVQAASGNTTKSEPGWRESGGMGPGEGHSLPTPRNATPTGGLVRMLEPRTSQPEASRRSSAPPEPVKQSGVTAPRKSVSSAPADIAPPAEDLPKPKSSGATMYIVLAIVVAIGAGAAAWFGGVIPH